MCLFLSFLSLYVNIYFSWVHGVDGLIGPHLICLRTVGRAGSRAFRASGVSHPEPVLSLNSFLLSILSCIDAVPLAVNYTLMSYRLQ